jgi:hypothetical protein
VACGRSRCRRGYGGLRGRVADCPIRAGSTCCAPRGCASIMREVAHEIDARTFDPNFPAATFPRFVQHALWAFCAQDGLNVCTAIRSTTAKHARRLAAPCSRAVPGCRCGQRSLGKRLETARQCWPVPHPDSAVSRPPQSSKSAALRACIPSTVMLSVGLRLDRRSRPRPCRRRAREAEVRGAQPMPPQAIDHL